jgi:hypothetical protein
MGYIFPSATTVVPAILALEALGFQLTFDTESGDCLARRGDEAYSGEDPVWVLGLVKLAEVRGRDWSASDEDIDATLKRFGWH